VSRMLVIAEAGTSGPRVRLNSCPRCRRPIRLDHAGQVDEDGEYVDLAVVMMAQRLHLATCAG
jgi:hypothetical protein